MRLLLHYDQTDLFEAEVRARFPAAEVTTCNSYDGLAAALAQSRAEVLYCIKFENRPYPRDAVMAAEALSWVAIGGAGVDHMAPWDPARLTVTNSAGVASQSMATYALGGIIALAMGFPKFLRQQRDHLWAWDYVGQVVGKTLCIVGLGQTGQALARMAGTFDLRVLGVRARPRPTDHVDQVYGPDGLAAALAESDYLVVATPLLPETRHMIDRAAVAALKPGAILVDVSRGGVVEPAALIEGLQSGHLGGAVLDVFQPEPMPDDCPLWDMENVLITPHCSSVYRGWELASARLFCDNLARWQAGEPLINIVDPSRGY